MLWMSVKAYRYEAPLVVSFPGPLAGAAAMALGVRGAVAVAELLGEEGISVEVRGAGGEARAAAENAARLLLEMLGEEARLRIDLSVEGNPVSPVAAAAGAAARAVAGLLGVEPDPGDVAEVLARATALATGAPRLPVAAAAYLGFHAYASEQPPLLGALGSTGMSGVEVAVILPCRGVEEPPVAVTGDRYRQLLQAAAAAAAILLTGVGEERVWKLLAQESPWDHAAPQPLRQARAAAMNMGALAASVDPYNPALVVVERPGAGASSAAAARLAAAQGCEPKVVRAEPLTSPPSAEGQPG